MSDDILLLTGSDAESIGMVLHNVVDAAAIDSNVLQLWMSEHQEQAEELHVMCSWGPWPIQPIVVNARLPSMYNSVCSPQYFGCSLTCAYTREV